MSACTYVGRVGGLAVALGVGAAILGGTAPAWADSGEGPTAARDPGTSQSAPARHSRAAGTGAVKRTAAAASVASHDAPRAAAAVPTTPAAPLRPSAAVRASASVSAPTANVAPARAARGARAAAPVSSVLSAPISALADPPPTSPTLPADSPAEWTMLAAARRELVAPAAATPVALVIGPSGVPVPQPTYLSAVMDLYLSGLPSNSGQLLFTPEGLYPITGTKSLPLNTSVDQGIDILARSLEEIYDDSPDTPVTVFGYSQSAIIGSLLQGGYDGYEINAGQDVNFVFVGNEMNPNGGFLSRFPNLNLPSLGIPFYGPTPENAYPTTNYALEYDGFADFPRYPANFLSVLNAGLGIVFVHTRYADPGYVTPERVAAATVLPTTDPSQKYYFMPTENLPLLEPLRLIPFIGNPIADLIQPALKVIVDLGYADPAHGFSSGTQPLANVLTPFGILPDVDPLEVLSKLGQGIVQGVQDFIADFGTGGSIARELSAISLPSLNFALPSIGNIISGLQHVVSAVADGIAFATSNLYAALLPTADIINAIVVNLPAYDVNLVLQSVQQVLDGDIVDGLINAVGLPIAADIGLATTAGLVGVLVWANAIATVLGIDIPGT